MATFVLFDFLCELKRKRYLRRNVRYLRHIEDTCIGLKGIHGNACELNAGRQTPAEETKITAQERKNTFLGEWLLLAFTVTKQSGLRKKQSPARSLSTWCTFLRPEKSPLSFCHGRGWSETIVRRFSPSKLSEDTTVSFHPFISDSALLPGCRLDTIQTRQWAMKVDMFCNDSREKPPRRKR